MSERKTKLEVFKEEGRHLRGRIAGDLSNDEVQVTEAAPCGTAWWTRTCLTCFAQARSNVRVTASVRS